MPVIAFEATPRRLVVLNTDTGGSLSNVEPSQVVPDWVRREMGPAGVWVEHPERLDDPHVRAALAPEPMDQTICPACTHAFVCRVWAAAQATTLRIMIGSCEGFDAALG